MTTNWWLDVLKRIKKIIWENALEKKKIETRIKIEPQVSTNCPLNSWALNWLLTFYTYNLYVLSHGNGKINVLPTDTVNWPLASGQGGVTKRVWHFSLKVIRGEGRWILQSFCVLKIAVCMIFNPMGKFQLAVRPSPSFTKDNLLVTIYRTLQR